MDRIRTRKWRWGVVLILVLGVGCWWWCARPARMRLVRVVSLGAQAPAFFGDAGGLYVRMTHGADGLATLALIGWDGQPRWQVRAPIGRKGIGPYLWVDFDAAAALSPDGRVFALAWPGTPTARVMSWRDGRPLGQARVPWASRPDVFLRLQATNSGRLWLVDAGYSNPLPPIRLWAIDGSRIATGRYTASFTGTRCSTFTALSPGGTGLLCYTFGGRVADTADLSVRGGRVRAMPLRTLALPNDDYYTWLDEGRARGDYYSTLLGRTAVLKSPPERYPPAQYHLYPARGAAWTVPVNRTARQFCATPDQRTALLVEEGPHKTSALALLCKVPLLKQLASSPAPRVTVYTDSGRRQAVLPFSRRLTEHANFALSPDGTQVALLTRGNIGQREIRVYTWGND